jgi:hypothetical protein
MAIAGVDPQSSGSLTALRNVQQTPRNDDARAEEAQAARLGTTDSSEAEGRLARLGTEENLGARQGTGVPGASLDSQSLNALIQVTQEQDGQVPTGGPASPATGATDSAEEAEDETRQQQVAAGNVTNSLAPGTTTGLANGAADTRGVSLLV